MSKLYEFIIEGENIDGDYICYEFSTSAKDRKDAINLAIKDARDTLEYVEGGHLDILTIDGDFVQYVEV